MFCKSNDPTSAFEQSANRALAEKYPRTKYPRAVRNEAFPRIISAINEIGDAIQTSISAMR